MFCQKNCQQFRWILQNLANVLAKFWQKIEIAELCKGVHCVDLDESFQTHIYLQNLASIQPRTSPLKFVGSRDSWCRSRSRFRANHPARGDRAGDRRVLAWGGPARAARRWIEHLFIRTATFRTLVCSASKFILWVIDSSRPLHLQIRVSCSAHVRLPSQIRISPKHVWRM